MPEVLRIESGSFEFPWTEEDFIRCLRQRNCIGMVAEVESKVASGSMSSTRTSCIFSTFAVHDEHRRGGVVRRWWRSLLVSFSSNRRSRILLEVRETNLAALGLFRNLGFRAVRCSRISTRIRPRTRMS
ncbi:MAG: GNAT family N-acetyltransferase [Pirellulaceae bacterium]